METKKESYKKIVKNLNEQQMEVWRCFMNNPQSADHEVSELLGLPLATINARRKELQDLGYIKLEGQQYFADTKRHRNVYNASFFPKKQDTKKPLSPLELKKLQSLLKRANDFQQKMIKAWLD